MQSMAVSTGLGRESSVQPSLLGLEHSMTPKNWGTRRHVPASPLAGRQLSSKSKKLVQWDSQTSISASADQLLLVIVVGQSLPLPVSCPCPFLHPWACSGIRTTKSLRWCSKRPIHLLLLLPGARSVLHTCCAVK